MNNYIIKGRRIYTMNDEQPIADWVEIKDKKIVKVGTGAINSTLNILDFGDNVVLPGLIDSHVHAGQTAIMLSGVDMIDVTSVGEALELIDDFCSKTEEELVFAPNYVMSQIAEQRFPTRQELDKVSHGKKVAVHLITAHTSSINTAAYETVNFEGMEDALGRNEKGEFNGYILEDKVHFHAMVNMIAGLPDGRYEEYIDLFGKMCIENGITTAHCLEGEMIAGELDLPMWIKKIEEGSLPFHCVLYPQVWEYDDFKHLNIPRHGGCLLLDGADMDLTMALYEPYSCDKRVRGDLIRLDKEVYNITKKAYLDNKQIAFHAMGDRAIDQALDAYRRVIAEYGQKNLRLRIEHFNMPRPEHVKLAAELGVVTTAQPEYCYLFDTPGGVIEEWFGEERVKRFEQYKELIDAGIVVAGGSDSPICSLNPFTGIHAFVNARFDTRRLSVTEALKAYTYNAAYAAFEENERGMIKEGYFADFTIIDKDPYEIPERINEIMPVTTISEGEIVYEKRKY